MSRDGRKKGLLLGAGFVAILLVIILGQRLSVAYTSRLTCCIKDNTTGGGLALARWAERLSFRVQPLYDPLWDAPKNLQSRTGNCVVTAGNGAWSPWREDMDDEQWASILAWIRRGNTLIVMTTRAQELPEPVRRDLLPKSVQLNSPKAKLRFAWLEPNVEAKPNTAMASIPWGGRLEIQSGGERITQAPEEWELAGDDAGGVLGRVPIGDGAVYLLLDGFAWTNAGFDREENVRALAAVLKRELRGGVVGFDEYRHGHGQVESFWTFLTGVAGAKTFLWISVILGGLYFYGRNVRFGPPEPYMLPERRTAREYIESAAYLYQRARAATLAVQGVERRFRHLALQRGRLTPEADQLLKRSEQYIAAGARPSEPDDACELVAELVRLRKQLYGT